MAPSFYAGWGVTGNNMAPITIPIKQNSCRDLAFHDMTRVLYTRFSAGRFMGISTETDVDMSNYAWWKWLRACNPQFTCTTSHPTYSSLKQWMQEYSLPLIVRKLERKFPSVEFSVGEFVDSFSQARFPAINLRGDAEIVPAFYWSTYLARLCAAEGPGGFKTDSGKTRHDWQDVNTLIKRSSYSGDHAAAWDSLRAGTSPSGMTQLALQSGPISAASRVSMYDRYRMTEERLAERVEQANQPDSKYHLWFADEVPVAST